jgi:hypothetical protein
MMKEGELDYLLNDDLCDYCMRSGVQVARVVNGKTVCTDCDEEIDEEPNDGESSGEEPAVSPSSTYCQDKINSMLERSQTKVIFPLITHGLVREYVKNGTSRFSDRMVRHAYIRSVRELQDYLGHDLHTGGKYYDAYPSRNLPRYSVVDVVGHQLYELTEPFRDASKELLSWIPGRIRDHINGRLGSVPSFGNREERFKASEDAARFEELILEQLDRNPTNFEVFSFAIIKVHLEKFACKVYRDTRTSASDAGVDLSTNFGVVYQVKKLKVYNKASADTIYAELKTNFDRERLNDGSVVLVIDDISKDVRSYLIDMKVQSISKHDLLRLASQFEDVEDREKVLRIAYEEYRREYASNIQPAT